MLLGRILLAREPRADILPDCGPMEFLTLILFFLMALDGGGGGTAFGGAAGFVLGGGGTFIIAWGSGGFIAMPDGSVSILNCAANMCEPHTYVNKGRQSQV